MERKREISFDNIKGFLIVLVVFGHFLYDLPFRSQVLDIFLKVIYMFHMPLFAFVSGYFSKGEFTSKKFFKYLFYYIMLNTILMYYSYIVNKDSLSLIVPYYSAWYLLALLAWRCFTKYFGNVKGLFIVSSIVAVLIGFWSEFTNVFAISRIVSFFPFFVLGYKISKAEILKNFKRNSIVINFIGLFLISIITVCSIFLSNNLQFDELLMSPYINYSNMINRIIIFTVAFSYIFAFILITPNKRIVGITRFGERSLDIFLYHRICVLVLMKFYKQVDNEVTILSFVILSIFICFIFSTNIVNKITNKSYESLYNVKDFKFVKWLLKIETVCLLIITLIIPVIPYYNNRNNSCGDMEIEKNSFLNNGDRIYEVLSDEEKNKIDNSFSILYVGDLILLKEQVRRGYNIEKDNYNFDDIFEYTKDYTKKANLSIGVFEGPMASEKVEYSNSDFDDNIKLCLNYPDEFGKAVKNAGFDLVTLANNHMLDKGIKGLERTVDILDSINLKHTGGYKTEEEKNNVQIIEKDGLKIGVLSYTYGCNYYEEDELLKMKNIPLLVDKNSKNFSKVKQSVEEDFIKLKEKSPDLIIVLPHMGTQFQNSTDDFQKEWNNIFIQCGANLILGDHAHVVQPLETRKNNKNEDVFIVNCPGNFVNSYREENGDATAMVEIYIDKDTKKLIASSIIPMWVQAEGNTNYRALPLYKIMNDKDLNGRISTYELNRVEEVSKFITKTMLNEEIELNCIQEKLYFLFDSGYKRKKVTSIDVPKDNEVIKKMLNSDTICFIGDSITEGTKNGGYPWYEPITNNLKNKEIINISKGGATSKTIIENVKEKTIKSNLYIIAIGANDIRYRNEDICAMDEEQYIKNIGNLINSIPNKENGEFIFIAPWYSTNNDSLCLVDEKEKKDLYERYSKKLEEYCKTNNYLFINPNTYIFKVLNNEQCNNYLIDYIHPNMLNGIILYSESVLMSVNQGEYSN